MGFPRDMFTVLFAIGRTPGWLAHWDEMLEQNSRIARPRQLYTGRAATADAPTSRLELGALDTLAASGSTPALRGLIMTSIDQLAGVGVLAHHRVWAAAISSSG